MQRDIEHVVVGVDFSESSSLALQYGAELAVRHGGVLVVVHVREETPMVAMALTDPMPDDELREMLGARISQALESSRIDLSLLPIKVEIVRDEAAEALIRAADQYTNSVIVVGHRGKSLLERVLLGSVATDVVKRAHQPVLVIRRRRHALPKHVLAAVDLGDLTEVVLRTAHAWATRAKATLTVLHVLPMPPTMDGYLVGPSLMSRSAEYDYLDPDAAKARLAEAVEEVLGPDHGADLMVQQGIADVEIHHAADLVKADLTVLGCHGNRGLSSVLLGNTAVRILRDAVSSVLVVRPPARASTEAPRPS